MAIVRTRLFESYVQTPKDPSDGTSLEEKMNDFLSTLPLAKVMDVTITAPLQAVGGYPTYYIGMVIYQED